LYKKVTQSPISKNLTPKSKKQNKNKNILTIQKKNMEKENKNMQSNISNNTQHTPTKNMQNSLPKISILSTNKTNSLLSIATKTIPQFNLCHYLTTNCSLKQLIYSLEKKLTNYTMQDFCVILIGEDDFVTKNDYSDIIIYLRDIGTTKNTTHKYYYMFTYF
jgi:hypothetical protein